MKMENLFVTWQQRSTPASMPISVSGPTPILQEHPLTLPWPPLQCSLPVSSGRGAGDPEAVIPPGALLCNSPALRPSCLAAWAAGDLWAPRGAGEAQDSWISPLGSPFTVTSIPPPLVVDSG